MPGLSGGKPSEGDSPPSGVGGNTGGEEPEFDSYEDDGDEFEIDPDLTGLDAFDDDDGEEDSAADAGPGEGLEDDGEAEGDGSGAGEGSEGGGGDPDLPDGTSWKELADQYEQKAKQAELETERLRPYADVGQRFLSEQAPPPNQPQGFEWRLPHQPDRRLLNALALQRGNPEDYAKLDPTLRQHAEELGRYVETNWDRWTYDPYSFAHDVIAPTLRPQLDEIRGQLLQLRAAEFSRRHGDVLQSDEARRAFLDLSQRMPQAEALELVKLRAFHEKATKKKGDADGKKRDRDARSRSSRGRRPRNRRKNARSGEPQVKVPKAKRADPKAVGDAVLRKIREDGGMA